MSAWETDEAALSRAALLAFGKYQRKVPASYLAPNPVGQGYAHSASAAVAAALRPFGREAVNAALEAMGRHVIRYGDVGSPDLTGWVEGKWVGLELKRRGGVDGAGKRIPPGVLEAHQEEWHYGARGRGAFVTVIHSPEEVAVALERARKGCLR